TGGSADRSGRTHRAVILGRTVGRPERRGLRRSFRGSRRVEMSEGESHRRERGGRSMRVALMVVGLGLGLIGPRAGAQHLLWSRETHDLRNEALDLDR